MWWHKIAETLKRLDERLSDAVYFHGSYLTGQATIVRSHDRGEMPELKHAGAIRPPGRPKSVREARY